jgi:hypothetical protein
LQQAETLHTQLQVNTSIPPLSLLSGSPRQYQIAGFSAVPVMIHNGNRSHLWWWVWGEKKYQIAAKSKEEKKRIGFAKRRM